MTMNQHIHHHSMGSVLPAVLLGQELVVPSIIDCWWLGLLNEEIGTARLLLARDAGL